MRKKEENQKESFLTATVDSLKITTKNQKAESIEINEKYHNILESRFTNNPIYQNASIKIFKTDNPKICKITEASVTKKDGTKVILEKDYTEWGIPSGEYKLTTIYNNGKQNVQEIPEEEIIKLSERGSFEIGGEKILSRED